MSFNPSHFGFTKLSNTVQGITFYERDGDADGRRSDATKLTTYLSHHNGYVVVWHGVFDQGVTAAHLGQSDRRLFDNILEHIETQFYQPLFRGYIATNREGRVILQALNLDHYRTSKLTVRDGYVRCD